MLDAGSILCYGGLSPSGRVSDILLVNALNVCLSSPGVTHATVRACTDIASRVQLAVMEHCYPRDGIATIILAFLAHCTLRTDSYTGPGMDDKLCTVRLVFERSFQLFLAICTGGSGRWGVQIT